MSKQTEERIEEAVATLSAQHALMAQFARLYGTPRLYRDSFDPGRRDEQGRRNEQGQSGPRDTSDAFGFLVETLVYQQLSGSSARAILDRLILATGLEIDVIRGLGGDELRRIGLSGPKIKTLERLCASVTREELAQLACCDDETVRRYIVGLYGFGEWSADMYLMFHLQRLDVWPVGDLAMRRSVERHLADSRSMTVSELVAQGERFRPFRSLAAWYFWADDHAQGR
ncbi:hypothetical protein [Ferrimicrobium sp.]|uniref:DNA-3-methyladenine glycosylase family protein n=1 Tax=Ferrimicrobium sp. TaxID=2926050 RepID=UPI002626622F|nr:hypothetical protein [Ferrimicrobium sp.]